MNALIPSPVCRLPLSRGLTVPLEEQNDLGDMGVHTPHPRSQPETVFPVGVAPQNLEQVQVWTGSIVLEPVMPSSVMKQRYQCTATTYVSQFSTLKHLPKSLLPDKNSWSKNS